MIHEPGGIKEALPAIVNPREAGLRELRHSTGMERFGGAQAQPSSID